MPRSTRRQPDKRVNRAARAVQRAIAKDNPTQEPPTVGKPVIIDPDERKPTNTDPEKKKFE
jgi:hypothetical protein